MAGEKVDATTFWYTCPFCGGRMKPHITERPSGVYYVDRECVGCGWWDLDDEGGV